VDDGGDGVLLKNGVQGSAIPQVCFIKRRPPPGYGFDTL